MTRITQVSAAAMLAIFASTAFVSTANSAPKKVWCQETSSKLFKTACEEKKFRKKYRRIQPVSVPGTPIQNFRARSNDELASRSLNGGNSNGGAGGGTGGGGQGGRR